MGYEPTALPVEPPHEMTGTLAGVPLQHPPGLRPGRTFTGRGSLRNERGALPSELIRPYEQSRTRTGDLPLPAALPLSYRADQARTGFEPATFGCRTAWRPRPNGWMRGWDLNPRPPDYESGEHNRTAPPRDKCAALCQARAWCGPPGASEEHAVGGCSPPRGCDQGFAVRSRTLTTKTDVVPDALWRDFWPRLFPPSRRRTQVPGRWSTPASACVERGGEWGRPVGGPLFVTSPSPGSSTAY